MDKEIIEENSVKDKKGNKKVVIGAVAIGAIAVASIVAGIVISKPKYLEFTADDNIDGMYNYIYVNDEHGDGGKYKEGEKITLKAESVSGYSFDGWCLNDNLVCESAEYSFVLSSETQGDYEARYSPLVRTLSVNSVEGGSVTIDNSGEIKTDSIVEINVVALDGYVFKNITYSKYLFGQQRDIPLFMKISNDGKRFIQVPMSDESEIVLTPHFIKIDYTLAVSCDEEKGSVTIKRNGEVYDGNIINRDDKLEFVVDAVDGFRLKEILVKSGEKVVSVNADGTYTMPAGDAQVSFVFEKVVLAKANTFEGETLGEVSIFGESGSMTSFEVGKQVTFKAEEKSASRFVGWVKASDKERVISIDKEMSIMIEENSENIYYAIFYSQTEQTAVGGLKYDILLGTKLCSVAGTSENLSEIEIPEAITYEGEEYKVVKINEAESLSLSADNLDCQNGVFQGKAVTSVDFSKASYLVYIGSGAFANTQLENVKISSSILKIGDYAFGGCGKLKTLSFLDGELAIGNSAFRDCPLLANVTLPSTVKSLGSYAFAGCEALTVIKIESTFVYENLIPSQLHMDEANGIYTIVYVLKSIIDDEFIDNLNYIDNGDFLEDYYSMQANM